MSTDNQPLAIFAKIQEYLTDEQETREAIRIAVRDLEQKAREIHAELQAIHQPEGVKQIPALCEKSLKMLDGAKELFRQLSAKVPTGQYYRFHDHWRFSIQRLCFAAALIVYLKDEVLIERQQAAEMIGVEVLRERGFHLDLEDFLMALLQLATELSRFAVNSVTAGDYERPIKIAKFVGDLDSGFRVLNLKNDALRKRYDGLKYDLKKAEEVVYEITIRGLIHKADGANQETVG